MSVLSLPIQGAVLVVDVPPALDLEHQGRIARTASNAVAAQVARKRRVNPTRYARSIVRRGVSAWQAGEWSTWSAGADEEERRLEQLPPDRLLPDLAVLMRLLVQGHRLADPRLPVWTTTLLGHAFGAHDQSCEACQLAEDHRWRPALRSLRVQPWSIANYWKSLVLGGFAEGECLEAKRVHIETEDFIF